VTRPRHTLIPAIACLTLLSLATAGCSEHADVRVNAAYGPGIKYTGIGTRFDWAPRAQNTFGEVHDLNEQTRAVFESIIEEHLEKAGFAKVPSGRADFWLRYGIATRQETDTSASAFGVPYEEGSLLIDVIDPQSRKIVWRGAARARIDPGAAPEHRIDKINYAMGRLMEKFPKS